MDLFCLMSFLRVKQKTKIENKIAGLNRIIGWIKSKSKNLKYDIIWLNYDSKRLDSEINLW